MINPIQQTIAYQVNVPQFMNTFKQKVVGFILPHLLELKAFINEEKNASTVNPLILVVTFLIVVYTFKSIWTGLFGKRLDEGQQGLRESPQLNAEVNQLKKQLKSLKTSFNELIKQLPNQKASQSRLTNVSASTSAHHSSDLWGEVLPLYTASLQNNKKLVNYVLESQFEMLKELKRFKKAQRASLSSGRPSTSTIRSKTSDKKIQSSISKSPLKTPLNTMSSIKKPQQKSTNKLIRSEINEKVEMKTEDSFLIPESSPKKVSTSQVVIESRNVEVKQAVVERNGFEKVQKSTKETVTFSSQQQSQTKNLFKTLSDKDAEASTIEVKSALHVKKTQSIITQETFAPDIQLQNQPDQFAPTPEPLRQVPNDLIQTQSTEQQQQQVQVFIPVKFPVIKKLNPPKQGGKRPPPPPPKR